MVLILGMLNGSQKALNRISFAIVNQRKLMTGNRHQLSTKLYHVTNFSHHHSLQHFRLIRSSGNQPKNDDKSPIDAQYTYKSTNHEDSKFNSNSNVDHEEIKYDKGSYVQKYGRFAPMAIAASTLFFKTKYLLFALKITKAGPLFSMVLTSFAYSFIYGWPFAIGMVGLICVHECGHAIVMYRYGIPFSPMVFIPFMGAVIVMKDLPKNAYDDAIIAFGGPVFGSLGALILGISGIYTSSQFLLALAQFGYMINLFNLLPIGSLDGGRIANAISPWFGVVGTLAACGSLYYGILTSPIMYLITFFGVYTSMSRLLGWDEESKRKQYYSVTRGQQFQLIIAYIVVVAALLYAMIINDKYRLSPRKIKAIQEGREVAPKFGESHPNEWESSSIHGYNGDDEDYYDDFFNSSSSSSNNIRDDKSK